LIIDYRPLSIGGLFRETLYNVAKTHKRNRRLVSNARFSGKITSNTMTFSDENTIIHHRANVCVNHPDREAHNLCVECGQWFCDMCMSQTHRFLCRRCADEAVEARRELERRNGRDTKRRSGRLSLPLVVGGLFALIFLLRHIGIGLIVLPVAFFLFAKHVFGGRRDVFIPKQKPRMSARSEGSVKTSGGITREQLAALLRIGGGRITAEKLAQAADVSANMAKKFLDRQVIEGTLGVEAGESELIYLQKPGFNGK
jgi:hypothetical protein